MKISLTLLLFLFFFGSAVSQVGIGTTSPNAQLDISASNTATPSNTDGLLIPKIDDFPATAPTTAQDGMMVFVTGNGTPARGFYYWDQGTTAWIPLGGGVGSEWTDNGSYLSPTDGTTEDVAVGGVNNTNAKLTVRGDKFLGILYTNTAQRNVASIGVNTYLENNTTASGAYSLGLYNDIVQDGLGGAMGVWNNVRGATDNYIYGALNNISGTGNGYRAAVRNSITGSGNGLQIGVESDISNSGDGTHFGNYNVLSGSGTGLHVGSQIELSGNGSGPLRAISSIINNTGNGDHIGFSNAMSGTGTGNRLGVYNFIDGAGTGIKRGVVNVIQGTSNATRTGVQNNLANTANGIQYGTRNQIVVTETSGSSHYGTLNHVSSTGNGNRYGVYNTVSGTGTGSKYGVYNLMEPTTGGTHYGLYSEALKTGSYAGFFLGDVAIGTTTGNLYTLPPSRGTAGQVMQTDGFGNVTWAAPSGSSDADWLEQGTGLPADAITDNIYTDGEVVIGNTMSTGGKLEVTDTSELRALHIRKAGNYSGGSGVGVLSEVSAVGTNFNVGFDAVLSTSGINTPQFGFTASLGGTASGEQRAFGGYIDTANDSPHVGINLLLQGAGTGNHSGAKIILGGSAGVDGDQTGIDNQIINQGSGDHVGINNLVNAPGNSLLKKGLYSVVAGTGSLYGIEQTVSGGGSNALPIYGIKTSLSSTFGSGIRTGIDNTLSGNSTGPQTGINNVISNSGDNTVKGMATSLVGVGNGVHTGIETIVGGVGDADKYGAVIEVSSPGDGLKIGTQNTISNGGAGNKIGTNNVITAQGESTHIGTANSLTGLGSGPQYGTQTTIDINETTSADHFGSYISLSGTGIGGRYGSYISLSDNNSGTQYGSYTEISNNGGGVHYGQQIILSGTGLGTKYGINVFKPTSSNGIGYGVYANVLSTGSYAGYFLGNVAVGTTTANTYTLPSSRGANGQIMQTDGAGVVSWANPSSATILIDTDNDTQIQVEETAGENVIRFDTNGAERMIIDAIGEVGINTNNPSDELHVKGTMRLEANSDTDYWYVLVDGADDYNFYYNGALRSYIQDTDGSYNVFSDRRLKKNITSISTTVSEKVMQLKPVNYSYSSDKTNTLQHGFIAQEVQKLFPELVNEKETENGTFLSLNYQAFGVLAIKTIQDQQQEIDILKAKVSALQELEKRIEKLEMN